MAPGLAESSACFVVCALVQAPSMLAGKEASLEYLCQHSWKVSCLLSVAVVKYHDQKPKSKLKKKGFSLA